MHQAILWEGERITGALASVTVRAAYASFENGIERCSELGQGSGRRLRILVVDDLAAHRQVISAMLHEACGHLDVVTASGGQEACDLLQDTPGQFDMVLCDWVMPEVDGPAVLQWMRGHPLTVELPFVMVSARDDEGDILGVLAAGAQGFLVKPETESVLCGMVAAILMDRTKDGV